MSGRQAIGPIQREMGMVVPCVGAPPPKNYSALKAYVTGGAGFVGRHLQSHLQECGDIVTSADRLTDGVDITDALSILDHMSAAKPDVVYHLAGQADVGGSWDTPVETFNINLYGTLNVLEAARRCGASRVIAVTSADIYGKVTADQLPLTEESEMRPVSPYAASKAAADMACLQAFLGYGQEVIRVRAFNHLGPGQSTRFVASALAQRVVHNERRGEHSVVVGDLTPRRDFTDVRDVARAYRMLATSGIAGEVYNICTGTDHSIQQIADVLLGLASHPMELSVDPTLIRPVDLPILRGSAEKLTAATGWTPEIPLSTTLADLLGWHRSENPS